LTLTCPRCYSDQTLKICDSPIEGSWEVFGCKNCSFLWRSTEDLNRVLRLREEDVRNAIWLYKGRQIERKFEDYSLEHLK
jgi:hypothetical protein